jgi:septal ring factor EnvC (AmiA/AmiB activator)
MAPTNASLQSIAAESKALKSEVVRLTSSLEHLHHQQLRQSNELTEQIKQAVSIEKETTQVLDRHNRDVSCFDKNIKLKYAVRIFY